MLDVPGAPLVYLFVGTLTTVVVASGIASVMNGRRTARAMALRGTTATHAVLVLLLVLPLGFFAGEVQTLAARVLPRMALNDPLFESLNHEPFILVLLGGCLLPGVGEELFFRGFLGRGLVARCGPVWGVLVTSALFGLMHLDPPWVLGAATLGVGLHVVCLTTKSLPVAMALHALNNALAFGLMRLGADPAWQPVADVMNGDHAPPHVVAAALSAVLTVGWLLYATRTRWVLPDGRAWSPGYVTAEMPPAHLGAVPKVTAPHPLVVVVAAAAYLAFAAALAWELRNAW
jgi:membrane protease YdiL (CAAX protease family)